MKTFKEHKSETEYTVYLEALELHTNGELTEFINRLSGKLKRYYDFIKELAETAKVAVKDLVTLLKNRGVFSFFQKIKFSVKNIFNKVKLGFKYYRDLKAAIAEYLASTKVLKWTQEKLGELDEFLKKHPKTRRMTGIIVGAILLYIWLNMSFTGDFDYDFDQSTLISAILWASFHCRLFLLGLKG